MDREEGLNVLTTRGWLAGAPPEVQRALLSQARWFHLEPGATLQSGDEAAGELIGLAQGCLALATVLGAPDTPLMHLEHPVFWLGYWPILAGRPRVVAATARTASSLASVPQVFVIRMLAERPEWWPHFLPLALIYGNTAASVAADLMIRGSERRCAAVLLRLGGRRLPGPRDSAPVEVPATQDDVAAAANLSRNTTGAVMRKLAARGLIELGYREIVIKSPRALRAYIDAV